MYTKLIRVKPINPTPHMKGKVYDQSQIDRVKQTCREMLADRGYEDIVERESVSDGFHMNAIHRTRKMRDQNEMITIEYKPEYTKTVRDSIGSVVAQRIILITDAPLKVTDTQYFKQMMTQNGSVIEHFEFRRLVFNVTKHFLVPRHTLLTPEEKESVLHEIKATENQLQTIEPTDPVAKYYGMLMGDVVMITRISETAGKYVNYRICVEK